MIDLHTHSNLSDGVLIPSELARCAERAGLRGLGITDHGDLSNIDFIIPRIIAIARELNRVLNVTVIPGIEITNVPPDFIEETTGKARALGAKIIVVHGETMLNPVAPGTNRAALDAGIDVLAHPGLITEEDVVKARENGVFLEITARKGHCRANEHVARLARKVGAKLVINTDAHEPVDIINKNTAKQIVCAAGLNARDFEEMQKNASTFL
jgi:putative hydrolase